MLVEGPTPRSKGKPKSVARGTAPEDAENITVDLEVNEEETEGEKPRDSDYEQITDQRFSRSLLPLASLVYSLVGNLKQGGVVRPGSIVYRGDFAKDEWGAAAIYQELAASPISFSGCQREHRIWSVC